MWQIWLDLRQNLPPHRLDCCQCLNWIWILFCAMLLSSLVWRELEKKWFHQRPSLVSLFYLKPIFTLVKFIPKLSFVWTFPALFWPMHLNAPPKSAGASRMVRFEVLRRRPHWVMWKTVRPIPLCEPLITVVPRNGNIVMFQCICHDSALQWK